jgi:hypothetical protein
MANSLPAAPDVDLHQRQWSPEELARRLDALEVLVRALEAEIAELKARDA